MCKESLWLRSPCGALKGSPGQPHNLYPTRSPLLVSILSSRIRNSQGLTWMPARKNDWLTSVMTPMLGHGNQITECAHGKLFPLLSDHWQVTLLLWISCGWFSFQRRELCYCKILEFCFLPTTPPAIPDLILCVFSMFMGSFASHLTDM